VVTGLRGDPEAQTGSPWHSDGPPLVWNERLCVSHLNPPRDSRKAILASELAWYEQEGHRRFSLDRLLYAPPAFDAVVQSSFSFLQMRPGELVLDMGCGEGKETLQLAQQGLLVVSIDLSHHQLCRARQRLEESAPDARVCFVQANAEALPFASDSFRIIYGKAILHHLDIDLSARETRRLLRRSGRATFAEPMAHHPFFWLARRLTPRLRTKDEHPLTFGELRRFCAFFRRSEIEEYFLLAPAGCLFRVWPGGEPFFRRLHAILRRVDVWLFGMFSLLRELAWYGLVKVEN
jgi:ubiquinone/menaquinone biosynthesis C-methylase UbiE